MTEHDLRQHVEFSDQDHDHSAVMAEVTTSPGSGGTARVSLHAESGHIAPGRRAVLVDAVLNLPEVRDSTRLEAAFPLGDSESLHRLQERCDDARTHPAGWSALLAGNLQPPVAEGQTSGPGDQPSGPGGQPAAAGSPAGEDEPPGQESSPR
jgi:hypothetical protein